MSRIFVEGLSPHIDDIMLKQKFEEFGKVEEVTVPKDRDTGLNRGFGFVRYASDEDAKSAIAAMDNADFDGRTIKVHLATEEGSGRNRRGQRGNSGHNYLT